MNVASPNAYTLLLDNATDSNVPVVPGSGKKKQAPKPAAAAAAAKAAKPAAPAVPTTTVSTGRGGSRRTFVRDSAETPEYVSSGRTDNRSQRPRGGAAPRWRGRQFDRHSATGLVDSEKKEKQGWLGDTEALVADGEKATEEAKKDNQDGAATPVPAAEEPEEVIKTLDDYLKEKSSKKVDSARNLRKANEGGVDKSQLKAGVALQRVEEDFFVATVGPKTRKQKERKEKIHVDINQHFVDQQRRGAFRSNRNEGGPRNSNNDRRPKRPQRANINDERDFPSL